MYSSVFDVPTLPGLTHPTGFWPVARLNGLDRCLDISQFTFEIVFIRVDIVCISVTRHLMAAIDHLFNDMRVLLSSESSGVEGCFDSIPFKDVEYSPDPDLGSILSIGQGEVIGFAFSPLALRIVAGKRNASKATVTQTQI